MSDHLRMNEMLPFYTAGSLDEVQRREVEQHLSVCEECRLDLSLWRGMAEEIHRANRRLAAPAGLADRALRRAVSQPRRAPAYRRAWQLLLSQAPMVRGEIWPASAGILVLGLAVVLLVDVPVNPIRYLAPMLAAAGLAILYSPDHDPAFELARATPTSPRQVLLARIALVFGYNFLLALAASLALLPLRPGEVLGALVMEWLGPMTFLSSAALLLSLVVGSGNAITIACLAWMAKIYADITMPAPVVGLIVWIRPALDAYGVFWSNPASLLLLSAGLVVLAVWLVGKPLEVFPRRWLSG